MSDGKKEVLRGTQGDGKKPDTKIRITEDHDATGDTAAGSGAGRATAA